jgi:hypothetical protein
MSDIRICEHCGKQISLKDDVWWSNEYGRTRRGFPLNHYVHNRCKEESDFYSRYHLMGESP